jgi:hypothetical protein
MIVETHVRFDITELFRTGSSNTMFFKSNDFFKIRDTPYALMVSYSTNAPPKCALTAAQQTIEGYKCEVLSRNFDVNASLTDIRDDFITAWRINSETPESRDPNEGFQVSMIALDKNEIF